MPVISKISKLTYLIVMLLFLSVLYFSLKIIFEYLYPRGLIYLNVFSIYFMFLITTLILAVACNYYISGDNNSPSLDNLLSPPTNAITSPSLDNLPSPPTNAIVSSSSTTTSSLDNLSPPSNAIVSSSLDNLSPPPTNAIVSSSTNAIVPSSNAIQ